MAGLLAELLEMEALRVLVIPEAELFHMIVLMMVGVLLVVLYIAPPSATAVLPENVALSNVGTFSEL